MARILIVDDEPKNLDLLDAHLDGSGHDVQMAVNGEEAIRLTREWQPDIMLLDVMMPKLSGFEVCQELRADPATANVGILMVTALDQRTDIDRAVEVGTDDFVTRPINKTELLLRVKSLLAAVEQRDATERALTYFGQVQQGMSVSS